ncbi:PadR family transcriptional regulator [Pengzhenrongella sicca]|uniref:PadR family transcriptional regulator n=1 Tax=Pengzhenrongella sicca TaxID=2819238 RepID=A0A8A4ZEU6_9MICO|nr:PadR family transcriptional regulator [Pengzhenrongella sicca]QTE28218.1 PadR family transcriptional regulator [Pengzhenrongella sicca]
MSEPHPPPAEPPWPSDWLRGVLELCVLRVLADGATYGYAIATRLADGGVGAVKGGTLYPLLIRLENAGLVRAQWRAGEGGPGRKYYELTAAGRAELGRSAGQWGRFTDTIGGVVAGFPDPGPHPSPTFPSPIPATEVAP